jgi:hypothetical protein
MTLILTLTYLLSLFIGYCCTFASWTGKLLRVNDMAYSVRSALYPGRGRNAFFTACLLSVCGIGYGFCACGFFPGVAIAFTFIVTSRVTEALLRPRIHNLFHLNLLLRTLTQRHLDCLCAEDTAGAGWIEGLIERVTRELYAIKVVKSAQLVPTYEGSTVYLRIKGAKADNYHCSHQSSGQR